MTAEAPIPFEPLPVRTEDLIRVSQSRKFIRRKGAQELALEAATKFPKTEIYAPEVLDWFSGRGKRETKMVVDLMIEAEMSRISTE